MYNHKLALVGALACAMTAAGLPLEEKTSYPAYMPRQFVGQPPTCNEHTYYHVSNTYDANGKPFFAAGTCSNTGGGCQLGHEGSYEVGTAITVGGGLSLDLGQIFTTASLEASYTHETVHGQTDAATIQCGNGTGDWTCAMLITPRGKTVTGYQYKGATGYDFCRGADDPGHGDDYTVWYPKTAKDGVADTFSVVCTCPNKPHADDAGAPAKCPMDCD